MAHLEERLVNGIKMIKSAENQRRIPTNSNANNDEMSFKQYNEIKDECNDGNNNKVALPLSENKNKHQYLDKLPRGNKRKISMPNKINYNKNIKYNNEEEYRKRGSRTIDNIYHNRFSNPY